MIGLTTLCLHELFSAHRLETVPDRLGLDSIIALLRLEARASIASISEILHTLGYPHDSTGMVSERLKAFGRCLSNTLNVDTECLVFFLSDGFSHWAAPSSLPSTRSVPPYYGLSWHPTGMLKRGSCIIRHLRII